MDGCCLEDEFSNLSGAESQSPNLTAFLNLTSNSTGVQSIEDLLLDILGPKRSPFVLAITLVYLLIFLTGLSGNLLTCTVIVKHKKMRTTTNLYLFSLAVSDLMVLLFGMPLEIYDLWQNYPFPFGEGGCYFKTFLFETVCFASILNVTALSVERYMAVIHPLKTRCLSTNTHARRVIAAVWAVSLSCAVPNTLLHGIYYLDLPEKVDESAICTVLKPLWMYNVVVQVTMVCFYFLPMTLISVLYLIMGFRLGREESQPRGTGNSQTRWKIHEDSGRRRQVTKMLSVVVVVFCLCWAPFHIERLLWSSISRWTDFLHGVYECVHILSGIMFYLSSAVNPVIYNLLSTRFRECFRELVCTQVEEGTPGRETPSFVKIQGPPGVVPRRRVKTQDSSSFIPLLSPTVAVRVDTTAAMFKEQDCTAL
ncbi:neuromedin-U receptor 2 [Osmerus eperlanus]|uniref:neuromedin-U receptor 2 n=1 Tax=Osmerus eperlanus TaxID=29151 RepID=UPI002E0EB240